MTVPQTKDDLNRLISDKVEENLHLDYKDARSLLPDGKKSPKTEIAKDVSAMANSAGGVVIYGIKEYDDAEKQHLPEKITPIDRVQFSREWLEQTINGNISPKIDGLKIHPVPLDQANEVAYVIEIPQSTTAHQNTVDARYYRRYNFISVTMLDHEIRDVMNRVRHPVIDLSFEIEMDFYNVEQDLLADMFPRRPKKKERQTNVSLRIIPANNGSVYARFINYFVYLPDDIVNQSDLHRTNKFTKGVLEFFGENTIRDIVGVKVISSTMSSTQYGPSRFDPVLPGVRGRTEELALVNDPLLDAREISWTIHADNAAPRKGIIALSQIPIIKRN